MALPACLPAACLPACLPGRYSSTTAYPCTLALLLGQPSCCAASALPIPGARAHPDQKGEEGKDIKGGEMCLSCLQIEFADVILLNKIDLVGQEGESQSRHSFQSQDLA